MPLVPDVRRTPRSAATDGAARHDAPPLVGPRPVAAPEAGARLLLTIEVEDADAVCAELVEHGVPLLNGPVDRPWGRRTAAFADPSGNGPVCKPGPNCRPTKPPVSSGGAAHPGAGMRYEGDPARTAAGDMPRPWSRPDQSSDTEGRTWGPTEHSASSSPTTDTAACRVTGGTATCLRR
ncbi:VOC family protein [Streptomyces sp. NPDC085659]|uniref:VOC family protein n=1 Tax=Streptomyces sp. NPDC085659 TaxID=3155177 RepID=UPI00344C73FC